MATQINIEELKTLIANSIKQENLHDVLPADAVERIKEKILAFKKTESAKEIPNVVSEEVVNEFTAPVIPGVGTNASQFPDENEIGTSDNISGNTQSDGSTLVYPGSVPTGEVSNPTMGYTPELPNVLKKAEPAQVFVFQYSDLNKSGENLSFKPLRVMDDPDVQMSMNDLWIKEGKTKADVYVAKFERIGEINFSYVDGVSKFIERGSEPDYSGGNTYKENPYEAASVPQIDSETKAELETYIKSSVDLEKVVHDIVMNVLKTSLTTPSELSKPEMSYGLDTADTDLPAINEGEEIELNITMKDIVENESYQKIEIPNELNEKINSGDKSMLIRENSEVQEWGYNGGKYYTPIGRISKNKGYIKS